MTHTPSSHVQRAYLLIEQRRFDQAQQHLGRALGESPDDPWIHALLAICLANEDKFREAEERSLEAVGLAPDSAAIRAVAARVALMRNDLDACERLATQAIALDPSDDEPYCLRAAVAAERKRWQECLDDANRALALDPDNPRALNLRAFANRGLGRKDQYSSDIRDVLQANPEDAYSHANAGWSSFERGDLDGAQTHFREALRLDPSVEPARIGVLETTKARFPVYRWFLGYLIRMAKLSAGKQLLLLIGLWLGVQFLGRQSVDNPILQVALAVVVLGYVAFCFATWFWRPVSNAALLLHPFARMALTRKEKIEAVLASTVFVVLAGLLVSAMLGDTGERLVWFRAALAPGLAMVFSFQHDQPKPRRIMLLACVALAAANGLLLLLMYGGDAVAQAIPDGVERLLSLIHRWGPLAVLFGSGGLSAQHWRRD